MNQDKRKNYMWILLKGNLKKKHYMWVSSVVLNVNFLVLWALIMNVSFDWYHLSATNQKQITKIIHAVAI